VTGQTRVDMRLTRQPAGTPRAKLHHLAAWGARCGRQLGAKRFAAVCEALTATLVQLEAAEGRIAELQRRNKELQRAVAFERQHNELLRTSLAAEQVRTAAAIADIPPERWEEPTRSRTLTDEERRVVDDPDAVSR